MPVSTQISNSLVQKTDKPVITVQNRCYSGV